MPKAKAQTVVAVEEPDYSGYKDKPATDLQERFGAWIIDKLSLVFGTKKEQAAFEEGVRLATAMRMIFQASPENQEVLAQRRAEAESNAVERAAKPADAPAKKATGKKAVAAAEPAAPKKAVRRPAQVKATPAAEESAEEVVSEPTPRKAARRPAARRPAAASASEEEAPF